MGTNRRVTGRGQNARSLAPIRLMPMGASGRGVSAPHVADRARSNDPPTQAAFRWSLTGTAAGLATAGSVPLQSLTNP